MIENLTPAQDKIVNDNHRFRVVNCGRRFGKTTLAILEMVGLATHNKDSRIAYIATTYQQSRDIAWRELKSICIPIAVNINESRLEIEVKTKHGGTSLIWLRGWESVDTLRGQRFDFLVIDEVASMRNFWSNWEEVLRPTLTDTEGTGLFTSTPKGYNHFYDLCNRELTDKEFKTFHFTSYDNPHLPIAELDKAKQTLPEDRFEQEYMASFQKTEGLVFKEFSREKHLYEELPFKDPMWQRQFEKYGGVDFGYRNPAAIVDIRFDGERIYVEDEWYKTERTDIQIAEATKLFNFKAVFPDPENPSGIEELRRKGVNCREVKKGKGSVESGIQSMREMFIRGTLMINKRCVNLISELESYSNEERDDDRNQPERPIKANDHAIDALRYIVSSLLPLVTRQEQVEVLRTFRYPEKEKKNPAR